MVDNYIIPTPIEHPIPIGTDINGIPASIARLPEDFPEQFGPPEAPYSINTQALANNLSVISPDGQSGSIPMEQWPEAQKQGFKLPGQELKITDLTEDKKAVKVVSPTGVEGTVPVEQLKDALAANYNLASAVHPEEIKQHNKLVKDNIKVLTATDSKSFKDLAAQHKNDDINDEQGNYKLLSPSGDLVSVAPKNLISILGQGFKFQDPNYQALIDAHLAMAKQGDIGESISAANRSWLDTLPGKLGTLGRSRDLSDIARGKTDRAFDIAEELASQLGVHKTAETIGAVTGIAEQMLVPGGIFGELSAAQKVGSLIKGSEALSGTPILAKLLAGAAEGAVISAPQVFAQSVIQKDPKAGAESLLLGIGLGGTLGLGGGLLSSAVAKIPNKPELATKALQGIGATEESLTKLGSQQEPFLKTLIANGLEKSSSPEKISKVLQGLSEGEALVPVLSKLEKIAEPIAAQNLLGKISEAANLLEQSKGLSTASEQLITSLTKLADESGNIALPKLQKYISEVGQSINWKAGAEDAVNNLKKQITKDVMAQIASTAEQAVQKVDAKIATAWAENKAITDVAQQLHNKIIEDIISGISPKTSPFIQSIKDILVGPLASQVAHNIGGAVGGFIGHSLIPIPVVGGAVGYGAGQGLTAALKHYIDNPANVSKLTGWLGKKTTNPALGSYMAVDAIHAVNQKAQEIAPFLRSLTTGALKSAAIFSDNKDPIKEILGPGANGLSKQQQFQKLSNQTAILVGNPQVMQQHLQNAVSPWAKDHPELTALMQQDMNNKIKYIHQILHSKNTVDIPAFQKAEKYTPTPSDLKEMEDQLKIVQNPFALLDGLKNGKVTAKQVAIAGALNPAILAKIREEVNKEAYSGKVNLSYQQRLSASIIMGEAMDKSLNALPQLQAIYGNQAQHSQAMPPSGGRTGHKINADKMPAAQPTLSQRLSK